MRFNFIMANTLRTHTHTHVAVKLTNITINFTPLKLFKRKSDNTREIKSNDDVLLHTTHNHFNMKSNELYFLNVYFNGTDGLVKINDGKYHIVCWMKWNVTHGGKMLRMTVTRGRLFIYIWTWNVLLCMVYVGGREQANEQKLVGDRKRNTSWWKAVKRHRCSIQF